MSSRSIDEALKLSDDLFYPMMNSHTGMRLDGDPHYGKGLLTKEIDVSERDISASQIETLAKYGGVIGMGTTGFRAEDGQPIGDQMTQWMSIYLDIQKRMKGRGVALGTDMNGLSPQLPNSTKSFDYPFLVDNRKTPSVSLSKCTSGAKTFDFKDEGIAHYGMLADFLQALRQFDQGANVANCLFRTAEDTIRMWEKVELASKSC
jgi:microsomal dipeptidase-like Zn-dependent dipeptidase